MAPPSPPPTSHTLVPPLSATSSAGSPTTSPSTSLPNLSANTTSILQSLSDRTIANGGQINWDAAAKRVREMMVTSTALTPPSHAAPQATSDADTSFPDATAFQVTPAPGQQSSGFPTVTDASPALPIRKNRGGRPRGRAGTVRRPTGRPPGRPRKNPLPAVTHADVSSALTSAPSAAPARGVGRGRGGGRPRGSRARGSTRGVTRGSSVTASGVTRGGNAKRGRPKKRKRGEDSDSDDLGLDDELEEDFDEAEHGGEDDGEGEEDDEVGQLCRLWPDLKRPCFARATARLLLLAP